MTFLGTNHFYINIIGKRNDRNSFLKTFPVLSLLVGFVGFSVGRHLLGLDLLVQVEQTLGLGTVDFEPPVADKFPLQQNVEEVSL